MWAIRARGGKRKERGTIRANAVRERKRRGVVFLEQGVKTLVDQRIKIRKEKLKQLYNDFMGRSKMIYNGSKPLLFSNGQKPLRFFRMGRCKTDNMV